MKRLSERTSGFTDSVLRRLTRVSHHYDAVHLSQGFPDFDPPKEITDRLAEIAGIGPHQYALTQGGHHSVRGGADLCATKAACFYF